MQPLSQKFTFQSSLPSKPLSFRDKSAYAEENIAIYRKVFDF